MPKGVYIRTENNKNNISKALYVLWRDLSYREIMKKSQNRGGFKQFICKVCKTQFYRYGNNIYCSVKCRHIDPNWRKEHSNKMKLAWSNEEKAQLMSRNNPFKDSNAIRKYVKVSRRQVELYNILKHLYPDAELQYYILTNYGKRFIDIAIPSLKLAIEYDGNWCHTDRAKEVMRDISLLEQGWKTLHVMENYNLYDVPKLINC